MDFIWFEINSGKVFSSYLYCWFLFFSLFVDMTHQTIIFTFHFFFFFFFFYFFICQVFLYLSCRVRFVDQFSREKKNELSDQNYCVINSLTKLKISLNIKVLDKCTYIYLFLFSKLLSCVKMTFSIITLLLVILISMIIKQATCPPYYFMWIKERSSTFFSFFFFFFSFSFRVLELIM